MLSEFNYEFLFTNSKVVIWNLSFCLNVLFSTSLSNDLVRSVSELLIDSIFLLANFTSSKCSRGTFIDSFFKF